MILITGASGTNGREIVKQLSAKGLQFRAMVRQLPAPVLQLPNVEYVVGDFTDLSSIRLALAGIDEAFLLSSSTAGQVERETNFMRMASEANVRHLVKFSILGADPDSPSTLLRRHGEIEQTLRTLVCRSPFCGLVTSCKICSGMQRTSDRRACSTGYGQKTTDTLTWTRGTTQESPLRV
jgi:hypothetical protein